MASEAVQRPVDEQQVQREIPAADLERILAPSDNISALVRRNQAGQPAVVLDGHRLIFWL
jgi:hypothetical protein